ncbi:MAG: hypothetical protein JSR17_03555, partial [Proteobacteria bacterium]|nr:hypothetical protein [Pseudomonadota bacterium]
MPATTMKDNITLALNNLRQEAKYPLIRFAKSTLNLDIEKSVRKDIVEWAKHLIMLNGDYAISKYILSSLDKAIEYVQNSLYKAKPKYASSFFNYVKDTYANKVVEKYLEDDANKEKIAAQTVDFAKNKVV